MIVGLDLSLTATGMATAAGVQVLRPKTRGLVRLVEIREWVLDGIGRQTYTAVVEGYSYASKFSHAHSLGELGGVVKVALAERQIDVCVVEPKLLKKFAANNGNASKADMLDAARRAGYEGSNDDNAVDAWWLYQFGRAAFAKRSGDAVSATAYRADVIAGWLAKREQVAA